MTISRGRRAAAPETVLARVAPAWIIAFGLLLVAGCGSKNTSAGPYPSPDQRPPSRQNSGPSSQNSGMPSDRNRPPDCAHPVSRPADVPAALDAASPGATVCFTGSELAGTDVTMNHSGTVNTPIRLVSQGATVRSIHVTADHVVVDWFHRYGR